MSKFCLFWNKPIDEVDVREFLVYAIYYSKIFLLSEGEKKSRMNHGQSDTLTHCDRVKKRTSLNVITKEWHATVNNKQSQSGRALCENDDDKHRKVKKRREQQRLRLHRVERVGRFNNKVFRLLNYITTAGCFTVCLHSLSSFYL